MKTALSAFLKLSQPYLVGNYQIKFFIWVTVGHLRMMVGSNDKPLENHWPVVLLALHLKESFEHGLEGVL